MASIDRNQLILRTVDVEHLIEQDHCARSIWEVVGRMDLSLYDAEIAAVQGRAGRNHTAPRLLISLWLYAYSRGISSARELSRQCEFEPGALWLCGCEPISYRTLSGFRCDYQVALGDLFVQVVGMLSAEGLVTMERARWMAPRSKPTPAVTPFDVKRSWRRILPWRASKWNR